MQVSEVIQLIIAKLGLCECVNKYYYFKFEYDYIIALLLL